MSEQNDTSEYAQAGVDYSRIADFKAAMIEVSRATREFPARHNIGVVDDQEVSHAAGWWYMSGNCPVFMTLTEGLGNLNYVAEWMYQQDPSGPTYYDRIARAAALIIACDLQAHGARPFLWTDEVAAGQDAWFADQRRAADYARGCWDICRELGVWLGQGESPALRYLVNTLPPVRHCPTLSGSMTGIVNPRSRLITGKNVRPGDVILGAPTPFIHANGITALIRRVLGDPDPEKRKDYPGLDEGFFTRLPNGRSVGDEALQPMVSYAALLDLLAHNGVTINRIVPGTGGGLAKLAVDKRPYTYKLYNWPSELPVIMQFLRELGMSWRDLATTFNCGIGMYLIVPREMATRALDLAEKNGHGLMQLGLVEEGERKVMFLAQHFDRLELPPPGH